MKGALWCLLFVNFLTVNADGLKWHHGSAVLSDHQVLTGTFSVNVKHGVLLHQTEEGLTNVYPAHRIQKIQYYDSEMKINRKFISVKELSAWELYEVVVPGNVQVVRKQNRFSNNDWLSDRDDFDYFIIYRNDVISFNQFRYRILPDLLICTPSFKESVDSKRFDAYDDGDLVSIVILYNTTSKDNLILSMN